MKDPSDLALRETQQSLCQVCLEMKMLSEFGHHCKVVLDNRGCLVSSVNKRKSSKLGEGKEGMVDSVKTTSLVQTE